MKSASLQYANALADIALAQGAGDPALRQLTDFRDAYAESAELRNFLASPAVDREAKHGVIERLVARLGASKIVRNFLFVVTDHGRMHILPEIVESFQEVIRKRQGIAEAEIFSAVDLTAAQKAEFAFTLERMTGQRIEPKYSLDPSLLGGAVVRIGDAIYDGSVRNRLNEMRSKLSGE
ncbi:MAG: ATP synthase F1 subunit delta [Acidobacteria bacterium]|nr:ATP synthase F1 subunit delta [Acidobacteriota bacterium]